MPTTRSRLAAAADAQGNIYAIGGVSKNAQLNTVEVYNPGANIWCSSDQTQQSVLPPQCNNTRPNPMPTVRFDLATATDANRAIYAIGGYNGTYQNTVEVLVPGENSWFTRASMPTARSQLAATTDAQGVIYAMGGYDGSVAVNTMEAYNSTLFNPAAPFTQIWCSSNTVLTPQCPTAPAPMLAARGGLAAAADARGNIYAIGGYTDSAGLNTVGTVERYTPPVTIYTFIHQ